MTDYRNSINDIIYLCSCAVNGISPDPNRIGDPDDLYEASHKHMLAFMVGMVLQKAGIQTKAFKDAIALAQRKAVILNEDLQQVTAALEAAAIWYMPLKGTVLQELYPRFTMREMADVDVLFDAGRAADVKTIMESLGFQVKVYGENNDDDYIKAPLSNFEMHKALFGERHDQKLFEYYQNVKKRLLKDEKNQYGYHFSPEDFYIFMIAHEYKHYPILCTPLRGGRQATQHWCCG